MVTLKMYNEKGNVSVKVRDMVRKQVNEKLENALSKEFNGIVPNANGGYSVPLAIDEISGETIYANIEFTINKKDPSVKAERKKTEKKVVAEESVSIF